MLIVDDHALFREGLAKIIGQEQDLRVCGQAANAADAMMEAKTQTPELVIVDISLEGISGLELTRQLREIYPDLRILILSMHNETVYAERALRSGADGYIMKQESGRQLLSAIHQVLDGKTYVSERIQQQLLRGISRTGASFVAARVDRLGAREFEVFQHIAQGHGTRQIAEALAISVKTVEAHRGHIREKLDLASNSDLIQYARDWAGSETNRFIK